MSEKAKSKSSRIYLIGYRGTGKSTLARLLAEHLGWSWLDADAVLEERAGQSIRQIFTTEGEAGFRARETAVLRELSLLVNHVFATGGGVVLSEENRRRLRESGHVIWLKANADTLWRRLQDDATSGDRRPPLTVGGLAEIQELLRIREPLYRACADLEIETVNRTPQELVLDIARQLE